MNFYINYYLTTIINANWLNTGNGNMYITNLINDTIFQKVDKVVVFYDDALLMS